MNRVNQRGITQILVVILILIGIIGSVYLVKHPTIFKPKAFSDDSSVVVFGGFSDPEKFRDYIFSSFGFTQEATNFIKSNSKIVVNNLAKNCGGGFWVPWTKTVIVFCGQHEAALHELSHVWWDEQRVINPDMAKGLTKDLVRLADGDGSEEAIKFARYYVYGGLDWKGMYCTSNGCADVHNIQDGDFDLTHEAKRAKIIDWEIYAGLSSWMMGQYKSGRRALPDYLWKYFEPQFLGEIKIKPYYDVVGYIPAPDSFPEAFPEANLEYKCEDTSVVAIRPDGDKTALYDCRDFGRICSDEAVSRIGELRVGNKNYLGGCIFERFPEGIFPVNDVYIDKTDDQITFEWEGVKGTDTYDILIDDTETWKRISYKDIKETKYSFPIGIFQLDKSYFWWAIAHSDMSEVSIRGGQFTLHRNN